MSVSPAVENRQWVTFNSSLFSTLQSVTSSLPDSDNHAPGPVKDLAL